MVSMSPIMDEPDAVLEAGLVTLQSSAAPPEVKRIAADLLPTFYVELKRIAKRSRARMGAGYTMQTTAVVHEAYLKLGQSRKFADETHFLRAAALAMRHALIQHARSRVAEKRGGGGIHLTLSHAAEFNIDSDEGLVALGDALQKLAVEMPRLAEIVECRFFGGYGEAETARALGISVRTLQRDWLKARAWLFREVGGAD